MLDPKKPVLARADATATLSPKKKIRLATDTTRLKRDIDRDIAGGIQTASENPQMPSGRPSLASGYFKSADARRDSLEHARRGEPMDDDDSFIAGTIQKTDITKRKDGTADTVRGPAMPARAHRIPSEEVFDDAFRRRSKGGR